MIHIKERLMQYADKYSGCYKYAGVYVKVIQDMIEQLLADLEEDEKENGWIAERRNIYHYFRRRACRTGRTIHGNVRYRKRKMG